MVSASTSPNQTRRFGVKFCPVSSNMATSPPPFSCRRKKVFDEAFDRRRRRTADVMFVPVSSRPQARG